MLNASDVLEAEILGANFLDPSVSKDFLAMAPIDLFRQPYHRNLYKMIQKLVDKGEAVNFSNIATFFTKHLESIGNIAYLGEIADAALTVSNLEHKIQQLAELDARRKGKALIEEYAQRFDDPSEGLFEEILDQFEQKALEIRPKTQRENRNVDQIIDWYESLILKMSDPKSAFGILTGWDGLDRMTLGFQRKDFIVVGARTSVGKTAFANEIKMRATDRGHKVADFSLEMSAGQNYTRMAANKCNIPMQALRTGNLTADQIEKVTECMEDFRKFHLDDTRGVTADYICSEMRRLKRQEGLDLVLIDYLQELVEPTEKSDNGGSAMHRIGQKLRKAAMDCDCAVIGLSQIKQEVDARSDKRPTKADLFGGAALAAAADGIILLYRDEVYNPDTEDKDILEVNLAKQRNGPIGTIRLHYDKNYQRISTITSFFEKPIKPANNDDSDNDKKDWRQNKRR